MKSERFPRLHTHSECYHSFCDQSVRLLQFMVECAWFHDGNCNSSWPCAALAGSKNPWSAFGVNLGGLRRIVKRKFIGCHLRHLGL